MWPQSLRRSSSGTSASSYDSLEDFLSEFEVVNKEEPHQSKAGASQPGQSAASRGVPWAPRPPRPAVRLSTHPYQPVRQAKRLQQEATQADAGSGGPSAAPHGYQQLALLPIPEPKPAATSTSDPHLSPSPAPAHPRVDWGHLSEPTGRNVQRQSRQPAQQLRQAALSPSRAPLEHFAEQLQADLGGSSLGRPPGPFQPSPPFPNPQQQAESAQHTQPAISAEPVRTAVPAAAAVAARPRQPLMPYPQVSAPSGGPAGHSPEPPRDAASRVDAPIHIKQVLQPGPTSGPPPPPRLQPAADSSSRDHGLSRPQPAMGGGSIPKSPVPSTLRMSQQVLRKKPRDFESELLDRLLNSYPPSAPAPVSAGAPSPAKPAFNAFHLPVSRALLVTVVLALMGVPLLLFMGGRLQAQHHLRSQVYVGAVSALTSSGEPLNSSAGNALPGGYGLDNVTGRLHPAQGDGRHTGLPPTQDAEPFEVEEHSAKHKRSQVGLKLLSLRVTLSVRELLDQRPIQDQRSV